MDGFSDFLEDLKKQGGPLLWVTQKKEFIENTDNLKSKRTPDQIKEGVLKSARLKHVIDQLLSKCNSASSNGNLVTKPVKRQDIENEAKSIIDEMAHEFDLKYVRMIGYVLVKVFARIYQHIYYNSDMVANLEVLKHYPVVMLPLHRSYMDFLLVSILCFHKNIQLPAIAAGQDFLGLSFIGTVLRRSGAFFIRRSFGSDELYWAIFHQYVHEHMHNCDRPLEFFIEGTRSRTSKSLQPKQGMISTCIELYMKGHRVPDIYFVPISLTYERLLEEILYSNELLGIHKPKESVNGLVKARSILNQCYGSIFINFARPVSFRELISAIEGPNLRNRLSHTLTPAFIFELNPQQIRSIETFSYVILLEMLRNQVIQPISIISTCILLSSSRSELAPVAKQPRRHAFEKVRAINLERLCYQVDQLKRILSNLGVKVYWPVTEVAKEAKSAEGAESLVDQRSFDELNSIKHLILDNLSLHSNLFDLIIPSSTNQQPPSVQSPKDFETSMKHARQYVIKASASSGNAECTCPFYVVLKQAHEYLSPNFNEKEAEVKLFESASLFIALCSYRNQLVHNLVRVSFACQSLLAALTLHPSLAASPEVSDVDESKLLGTIDEYKAYEVFKLLVVTFNKEFIFNAGDESKDFQDAVRFLIHTNLLKLTANSAIEGQNRTLQLDKFNIKKFFFYIRIFRSCLYNYIEIYSTLLGNSKHVTSFRQEENGTLEYIDEKTISKAIQQTIFDKMIQKLGGKFDRGQANRHDLESLSMNMISNSLLSLKQFGVLVRVNGQLKENGESKYRFVMFLDKLTSLNDRLMGLMLTNEQKLKYLNKFTKKFYPLVYDRSQCLLNSPGDMDDDCDDDDENETMFDQLFQPNSSRNLQLSKL